MDAPAQVLSDGSYFTDDERNHFLLFGDYYPATLCKAIIYVILTLWVLDLTR